MSEYIALPRAVYEKVGQVLMGLPYNSVAPLIQEINSTARTAELHEDSPAPEEEVE